MANDARLTERLTVLISSVQREKVKRMARAKDRSENWIIRKLIDQAPEPKQ